MNVVSFYRFCDVDEPAAVRGRLQAICDRGGLLGTILVAPEGVNGTLAGEAAAIRDVFAWLESRLALEAPLAGRWTEAAAAPFRPMPVRDTRNSYEFEVGTFTNAVDPKTDSFREFPGYARALAAAGTDRRLAMFCTGGIRCEKATALMMELGFREVYQLDGGILRYLEEVEERDNLWHGECFVFDTRVAVDRDLAEGGYVQCHACRRPLSAADLESPDYREGVSCPRCIDALEGDRKARLEERRRQVALADARGDAHIGVRHD